MAQREFSNGEVVIIGITAKFFNKSAEGVSFIRATYDSVNDGKHVVSLHLSGGTISIQEFSDLEIYKLTEIGTAAAGIIKDYTGTNAKPIEINRED